MVIVHHVCYDLSGYCKSMVTTDRGWESWACLWQDDRTYRPLTQEADRATRAMFALTF